MNIPTKLQQLEGEWTGSNRLTMSPEDPVRDSESTATVAFEANKKALRISYDWTFDGAVQNGLMIFCFGKTGQASNVWLDSFHQSGEFMKSAGEYDERSANVKGFYTIPEYSDWGWRTIVESDDPDSFSFTMYNVTPEGEEHVAVEAAFKRKK